MDNFARAFSLSLSLSNSLLLRQSSRVLFEGLVFFSRNCVDNVLDSRLSIGDEVQFGRFRAIVCRFARFNFISLFFPLSKGDGF